MRRQNPRAVIAVVFTTRQSVKRTIVVQAEMEEMCQGEMILMNPELVNAPADLLGWTPEEEARIQEIIAGFDPVEARRIIRYSTLRMEAIRRMRREQMKNAPLHVERVKPNASALRTAESRRNRPFGRPRKYNSNAARQRAYRERLSRTLQKLSVTGSF